MAQLTIRRTVTNILLSFNEVLIMNNKEIKYFENTPKFQIFSINKLEKDEVISYAKSIRYLVADLCGLEILNEKELCLLIR